MCHSPWPDMCIDLYFNYMNACGHIRCSIQATKWQKVLSFTIFFCLSVLWLNPYLCHSPSGLLAPDATTDFFLMEPSGQLSTGATLKVNMFFLEVVGFCFIFCFCSMQTSKYWTQTQRMAQYKGKQAFHRKLYLKWGHSSRSRHLNTTFSDTELCWVESCVIRHKTQYVIQDTAEFWTFLKYPEILQPL